MNANPINATIEKFGYPARLVREFGHWLVLVRPAQVTLGSLVLAAKGDATAYGGLPATVFAEQATVIAAVENGLSEFCGYERINYLMLMMVERHVHFHVIPRYPGIREWDGTSFADHGWLGSPALQPATALSARQVAKLRDDLAKSI